MIADSVCGVYYTVFYDTILNDEYQRHTYTNTSVPFSTRRHILVVVRSSFFWTNYPIIYFEFWNTTDFELQYSRSNDTSLTFFFADGCVCVTLLFFLSSFIFFRILSSNKINTTQTQTQTQTQTPLLSIYSRMLKCIVLPIVFVNVVIAVVDMMQMGKAGGVGGTTGTCTRVQYSNSSQ